MYRAYAEQWAHFILMKLIHRLGTETVSNVRDKMLKVLDVIMVSCWFVGLFVCLFVCLFVHSFICLFVWLFICLLFIYLFVNSFVCLFGCLFGCLFVCYLFIYLLIHLFICYLFIYLLTFGCHWGFSIYSVDPTLLWLPYPKPHNHIEAI